MSKFTTMKCYRCHRPLKDPVSIQRGFGPVCYGKAVKKDKQRDIDDDQPVLQGKPFREYGLVCVRQTDGRLACNIPQIFKHHSPTGFECGYGGSGPADLALNAMALWFPKEPGDRGVKLWDGQIVSSKAFNLHQRFKFYFIQSMDRDGGMISVEKIVEWLEQVEETV